MRKTRIEVRADIAARANVREVARLVVDNWYDEMTDIADSNGDTEIDSTNMNLVEFSIQTIMF